MWTDLVALMKVGVRRGKIIVVRPEHDHGAPSYAPKAGRAPTSTGAPANRAGCAARPMRTAVLEGRNLFWCPTCQT